MKPILLPLALALTLAGGGVALADPGHGHGHGNGNGHGNPGHDDWGRGEAHYRGAAPHYDNGLHRGHYKRWARGERLPSYYLAAPYYVDYRVHHLRPPPRGYRWVRVDNQYLLVGLATGLIASLIVNS
jgi:Ni/Co efflux regulator RcnB